ncbi:hypothetical protein PM082_008779 [Marasmius tenuissimus]|nr:hypothetical protein PM082_008779 [Marasmius tenuissimus]
MVGCPHHSKFISCRGKDYVPSPVIVNLLVGMPVCDGLVDKAFRLIAQYDIDSDQTDICYEDADVSIDIDTDADTESTASSRTQPYATLISSLPCFDPLFQGMIDHVPCTARYPEIRIGFALFSALIYRLPCRSNQICRRATTAMDMVCFLSLVGKEKKKRAGLQNYLFSYPVMPSRFATRSRLGEQHGSTYPAKIVIDIQRYTSGRRESNRLVDAQAPSPHVLMTPFIV